MSQFTMNDWYIQFRTTPEYSMLQKRPIAYFCAEFAISDTMPIFAGGLGVLAGDLLREAADQQIPIVAVGLYYREGYVKQIIDTNSQLTECLNCILPQAAGLMPVIDDRGNRVFIPVPVDDTIVYAQCWRLQIKKDVTLYLLDTDISENSERDQHITDRLYATDKETRLKQEIVLGIGGLRLLEALSIHPSIYHMNEGHSALLSLELIRHEMQERKKSFLDAKEIAKQKIVFTNHTLVAAGNDLFSIELVTMLLKKFAEEELQVPIQDIIALGRINDSNSFSLTNVSLRIAGKINAVSALHAKNALSIWTQYPMQPITNGVYVSTWDHLGTAESIWDKHLENKRKLLSRIQEQSGQVWKEDELLIGWARRIVQYKRPLALFDNIDKFIQLAQNQSRPVRVVFAGEAHPSDEQGLEILKELNSRIKTKLQGVAVYLPNYNLSLAKLLIAGCDVWLNTPVVGSEACGTSGMKAALNGVLPLTTRDGWVGEIDLFGIGWQLSNDNIAQSIYSTLEQNILPMYYDSKPSSSWIQNMKNAREMVLNQYSTLTMLKKYIQFLYQPILRTIQ